MTEKLLNAAGGCFINPEDCGSMIRWVVDVTYENPKPLAKLEYDRKGRVWLSASVGLSDCSRRIEWELSGGEISNIEKLDNAIGELRKLRTVLVRANKLYERKRQEFGLKEDD
jgi:hypothetical protein